MSNEPVGFTGGIDTFNRYSYVGNNPYKYTDPTGMFKNCGEMCSQCTNVIQKKGGGKDRNRGVEKAIGDLKKVGVVDEKLASEQKATVLKAKSIVDVLLKLRKVPYAAEYVLDSVKYDPSIYSDGFSSLSGTNTPTSMIINSGKITIYAPGAATLKSAIITYGHELGHFNLKWHHPTVEAYGQEVYKVYKGAIYGGPKP